MEDRYICVSEKLVLLVKPNVRVIEISSLAKKGSSVKLTLDSFNMLKCFGQHVINKTELCKTLGEDNSFITTLNSNEDTMVCIKKYTWDESCKEEVFLKPTDFLQMLKHGVEVNAAFGSNYVVLHETTQTTRETVTFCGKDNSCMGGRFSVFEECRCRK